VHLIDLSRWLSGADFSRIWGQTETLFWNMPVDDNAFVYLANSKGQTAWLQASCSEWKNMFCLEIYGKTGKLQIDGLGGSYGPEKLTFFKMLPQMGPPQTTVFDFPGPDGSWQAEFADLVQTIDNGRHRPCGDLSDALAALKIVEKIYQQSAEQKP
jgi:predicted dehydrogenase